MKNQTLVCLTGIALAVTCGWQAPAAPTTVALNVSSQSPDMAKPGDPAAYSVRVTASVQKSLAVNLTASGLPAGVTAFFRPNSITFNPGGQASVNSLLTLTTQNSTPPGTYPFTVTGTYRHGSTRTVTASGTLVVVEMAPRITALNRLADRSASLTCLGIPDQLFFIQATTDLRSAVWTTIATNHTDAVGWSAFVEADSANYPSRFYRTSLQP